MTGSVNRHEVFRPISAISASIVVEIAIEQDGVHRQPAIEKHTLAALLRSGYDVSRRVSGTEVLYVGLGEPHRD